VASKDVTQPMITLTYIELAQLVLIGVGIILAASGPILHLSRSSSKRNIPRIVVASPLPDPKKLTSRQQEVIDALSYRPVPVVSKTPLVSMRIKVEESPSTAKLNNLKDTVRMKIAEAYISSKRLLAAIRKEIFPDYSKQIQFNFAGVILGPFSEKEVRRYMEEGYLVLSDIAKGEGDAEWSTLQNVLECQDAQQCDNSLESSAPVIPPKPLKPARYQKQGKVTAIVPRIVLTDSQGALIYNS
jgi:hypothetical protein